jgi:hydroxypyruvate reductase
VQAGIRAVDARRLVDAALVRRRPSAAPVWVIAAGKAAGGMAAAALDVLGPRVAGGLIVSPAPAIVQANLDAVAGEHPQPGPGSHDAGRRALGIAAAVPADAELVILISGGASSLLALPAEGLQLEDKRLATRVLLRAGADIYALNTVRKHLSRIKGGRLAAASAAPTETYVLSDVVGDDLSVIASGPTVPDASTYVDALAIVDRFGGRDAYPPRVVEHLVAGARGQRPESPKPGDPRLARAVTTLVGGRHDAMRGAAIEARRRGYDIVVLDEPVVGDARTVGPELARRMLQVASASRRPACVVASGETTVRVTGHGLGGRNQELALSMADALAGIGAEAVFASAGTDGIDGPTDAAGAIVDAGTIARATETGMASADAYLDDNDSYRFFESLGDLIKTGPTGTNVGDLQVFLLA